MVCVCNVEAERSELMEDANKRLRDERIHFDQEKLRIEAQYQKLHKDFDNLT